MRSHAAAALLITEGLLIAACGSSSTRPVMPTAPTPVAVVSGLAVSGKVYDTAFRPLAGATVQVVNGPDAGRSTIANHEGQFLLTGAFDAAKFRATQESYSDSVATMPAPCAQCNPQHWIHFRLGSPVPPADIAGNYTLTVNADASCSMLPPEMRSRAYAARIVAMPNQATRSPPACSRPACPRLTAAAALPVPRHMQPRTRCARPRVISSS